MNELDKLIEIIKKVGKQKKVSIRDEDKTFDDTFMIVGLGNPGREYQDTRHNIGFKLVDEITKELGLEFSRTQAKALITKGIHQGNRIILIKPQSFMNKSGHAVHSLLNFYKLKRNHLLVVYDDVDLSFGLIRLKPSGGSAGHRGVESIINQLGSQEFPRLRFGVGRPPGSKQAANYVLKPFNKLETEFLPQLMEDAVKAALAFTSEGIGYAMTHFNKKSKR
jgi:PTH1 family peptidyl-tRNA hydrolase